MPFVKSGKGADARRQTATELAKTFSGGLDTATVLREFLESRSGTRSVLRTFLLCLAFGITIVTAVPPSTTRIQSSIDESDRFTLRGNTRPVVEKAIAQPESRLSSSFTLPHIVLQFVMTPAQQADLEQLLRDQQDRRSPQYHRFLTPEQYAARFGLGDADITRILNWLREEGFSNPEVARSKAWVSFSGTAAQTESAFHITLRHYKLNGETYYANTSDPQLPRALQSVVGGVGGFHNFGMKPFTRRPHPNFSLSDGITHYLAPNDWGIIYNVKPLWNQGIDGTGVRIAVVGQSDVQLSDLQAFRAASGLSPRDPTIIVPPGLKDPGIQKTSGDEIESDLDLEWAGAIAPNADIIFITASGGAGLGVEEALTYAIDNNVAPIISTSYGNCEADESKSDFQTMNNLLQQANAQGITIVAASGDSGPAACDTAANEGSASHGYAVSFPASSAYVTGIGGTTLQDYGGTDWAATNNGAGGSALRYDAEAVWDDGLLELFRGASGGGASALVGKPIWQSGTGVPADNARDVPDLAFSASPSHDGYLICSEGSCRNGFLDNNNNVFSIGGTSAPTPAFAAVLALVIQEHGSGGSLGNINPNLYSLAQFSTDIFHDVTTGSNTVPCNSSTMTSCSHNFQLGFQAGSGYDLATGWGSLDATQFAEQWYGDFQIAVSPASLTLQKGSSATANITLSAQNNFNGPVKFSCSVSSALSDVSCSIPDTSLNRSGTTTITINAASTARSPWWKNLHLGLPSTRSGILPATLLVIVLLIAIGLSAQLRWRRSPGVPLAGLIFAVFTIAVISCGGSSSPSSSGSGTAGPPPLPSPPQLTLSCGFSSAVTTGLPVSGQCSASGGTGALTFNVISGMLPPGLALDPYTGSISGVATKVGSYSFTVQVTDSGTPQQNATYAETLNITSSLKPLTLACNLPAGALTGAQYAGSCSASGGVFGDTYSISAGSLPVGLAINSFSGSISGVPTSAGTSSFTAQVTDGSSFATQTINNFVVGIGPLASLSCNVPISAYTRTRYNGQCSAVGGQPPFTYTLTAGALPQGLTLNSSTGVVSGVPLVVTNGMPSLFTITVTDSSVPARTASQSTNMYVFEALPISIYWPTANPASLGVAYSAWCSIGGNDPITVSILSGQLPPGLQLDSNTGIISGTPTAMGTYPLTIQAMDSSVPPFSAQASNVITVGPRPSETGLITITATSGSIVSTATLQLTVP